MKKFFALIFNELLIIDQIRNLNFNDFKVKIIFSKVFDLANITFLIVLAMSLPFLTWSVRCARRLTTVVIRVPVTAHRVVPDQNSKNEAFITNSFR